MIQEWLRKWEGIIIHHSETSDDGHRNDWEGIRRFHMSWRLLGETITQQEAQEMIAAGERRIAPPWHDIGYHFGIEKVNDVLTLQTGRPLWEVGAHCVGKNETHIGVCIVGNFDSQAPTDEQYIFTAKLCARLMREFPGIYLSGIEPHRKYAPKTCPGRLFIMDTLLGHIQNELKGAA